MSYVDAMFIRNHVPRALMSRQMFQVTGPKRDAVVCIVHGAENTWHVGVRAGAIKLYTSDLGSKESAERCAQNCHTKLYDLASCREASLEDHLETALRQSV